MGIYCEPVETFEAFQYTGSEKQAKALAIINPSIQRSYDGSGNLKFVSHDGLFIEVVPGDYFVVEDNEIKVVAKKVFERRYMRLV